MAKSYDFGGYATKANRRCADGRIILPDAFKDDNNRTVPLVWNHQHDNPANVLGHALLENRKDGVYAFCSFNDTENGQEAKRLVKHGDIVSLSIYANQLKQRGSEVLHGVIREVSLVLAGANPDAFIDTVLAHGIGADIDDDEGIIYMGERISLSHADNDSDGEELKVDEDRNKKNKSDDEETVEDVFNSMTEKQKTVVYALLGQALQDNGGGQSGNDDDESGEGKSVKHNIFDSDENQGAFLSHADMEKIFADGKRLGSLREAVNQAIEDGVLAHSIDTTGMTVATGTQTYGFNDPSMLFPDYKSLNNPPEWISRRMDWVRKVMSGVHHTPFSRIKSVYANITEDDARARGYIKGKQKKEEVFTTLKRTTDPQTVYKKQKLDRDDIIDITDFDVVMWIRSEMRLMLDEEIARAITSATDAPPILMTISARRIFAPSQKMCRCLIRRSKWKSPRTPTNRLSPRRRLTPRFAPARITKAPAIRRSSPRKMSSRKCYCLKTVSVTSSTRPRRNWRRLCASAILSQSSRWRIRL